MLPPRFERSVLTDLDLVNMEDLYPVFLEADAAIVGEGHFPLLSRGRYVVLQLDTDGRIWQTISGVGLLRKMRITAAT
jgi:hypothetical protein